MLFARTVLAQALLFMVKAAVVYYSIYVLIPAWYSEQTVALTTSFTKRDRSNARYLMRFVLVLLIGAFFIHQLRRRHQEQAKAEAAELATREAQQRAEELERLVAFGQALGRSLDFDSIRVAITQHLPTLAGTDRVWVLVQNGSDWQSLQGESRGAEDSLQWGDLAEQLLATRLAG